MPSSSPASELVASLLGALDQLELRSDQWVDAMNARRANSLRAMTADRTRLALDLDLALARARDAETALAELAEISARDVGTVIGEVRAILDQSTRSISSETVPGSSDGEAGEMAGELSGEATGETAEDQPDESVNPYAANWAQDREAD